MGLVEKKSTRIVYRIENPEDKDGMWYDKNGVFRKTLDILCPNGIAKDFPMPLNLELHRKDGLVWNSAGKSIQNMNEWFTAEDAISLYHNGFKLFRFEVDTFQELENEILFWRGGIIKQEEIPLETVWEINKK